MAVPKRKTTPSKRDMRRAQNVKITPAQYIHCDNCRNVTQPHRACAACGFYKGRLVIAVKPTAG
ncbi:MAG: 50S ribosomal protein L32 [Myxococcales bacterium]|nr:50S ribosomal protein L32 [Myxococcales bacterium]